MIIFELEPAARGDSSDDLFEMSSGLHWALCSIGHRHLRKKQNALPGGKLELERPCTSGDGLGLRVARRLAEENGVYHIHRKLNIDRHITGLKNSSC